MAQINGTLELDGSTLTFRFGGSNETVVSAGTPSSSITLSLPTEGSSTFATRTLAETLTNKTLTSAVAQDLQVKSSTGTGNTVTVKPSDVQVSGSSLLLNIQGGTARTLTMGAGISVTGGDMQVAAAFTTAAAVNIGSTFTTVGAFSTAAAFSTAGAVSIGAALTTNALGSLTILANTGGSQLALPTDTYIGGNFYTGSTFTANNAVSIAGAFTTTGGSLTVAAHASGSTLNLSNGALTLSYTAGSTLTLPTGGGTAMTTAAVQTVTGAKTFESTALKLNNSSSTITLQTHASALDGSTLTLRPLQDALVNIDVPQFTVQGSQNISLDNTAGASRVITIPASFASADEIVGRTSTQTLTAKTLTAPLLTQSSPATLDVASAGGLTIGASVGANDFTLGGASSTVVIPGNLTVQGTTTTISTTNLDVEDAEISLNVGGSPATPADGVAGIRIDTALANDPRIDWHSGVTSGWRIDAGGASSSPQEIIVAGLSQTLTGQKTFSSFRLSNTSTITVQTDGSATNGAALTLRPAAASVVLGIQNPNLLFNGTGDLTFSSPVAVGNV